jgi:deoxyribodipyrimidine photolyase-related protein
VPHPTTRTLRFILGDQLSLRLSTLKGVDKAEDVVLMAEVNAEATFVKYHKKKLVLIYAAMRHHAADLIAQGYRVHYFTLDDKNGPKSLGAALEQAIAIYHPEQVVVTEPGAWRVLDEMRSWSERFGLPVIIREDDRFFASRERFARWAAGYKKTLRMEFFYRELRKETGLLMQDGKPAGGEWNFDHDNRKALPKRVSAPARPSFPPDAITREVMTLVERHFGSHFGDLEPFDYPVTREAALDALEWFVDHALADFGTYQDAMRQGEPLLFHSHLSALMNCGLLDPREVCEAASYAWLEGQAPLNSVEGFIRQILGWREYIRGVYWLRMPAYGRLNALGATHKLPWFFWSGETEMNCMAQAIGETRRNAYAHHIQRLMVIGDFCLIAGLAPDEVQEWYLIVYHDAYEWVEMPNVVGMILHADGGFLASKPYAASGAYIDRMSDYCRHCRYDVRKRTGQDACPFNFLYWDFLARHRNRFETNQRMAMMYRTLDRLEPGELKQIRSQAETFLVDLD